MTSIGVRQATHLALYSSLISIAAAAIGHPAIAAPGSPATIQPLSYLQPQPTFPIAQASQPTPSDAAPTTSEFIAQSEPEREIEFTSPTFTLGVQGEGTPSNGAQGDPAQGETVQGEAAQEPLEAGAQQDAAVSNEAEAEALAAQHEWVEFSVEDSNEAIARYGCDDLYCINALREQRGLPPLQLVWDEERTTPHRQ